MARIRRISVFLPRETAFYSGLLEQILRGFEGCGITATGALAHLGPEEMAAWLRAHRPDAILEMNRPRADATFLPKSVAHIVWVVDWNGRSLAHFDGSELTYLMCPSWVESYPHAGHCAWLAPGCDPEAYPGRGPDPTWDASFAGHVPRPWSPAELARRVAGPDHPATFAALVDELGPYVRRHQAEICCASETLAAAEQIARSRWQRSLELDEVLRYDLTSRLGRQFNRRDLIDSLLAGGVDLRLFGTPNWAEYPEYAPAYRGFLETAEQMHSAYRHSAVNLHEGVAIHFRSLDVMCSQSLVFVRETPHDGHATGGMHAHFEPLVHYVPFTYETVVERVAEYAGDRARSAKIARAAADRVRSAHTWRVRAEQIVSDLAKL